jgi:hypothetical protein
MRNPHFSEHINRRRHCHDPKGPGVKVSGSVMHDAQLASSFWAPSDVFRYTTEELHSATAQYATINEATGLHLAPWSRETTPSSCCDRTASGRGSSTRISLSDSQWSENTINTHKYNTIYCSSSRSFYTLGSRISYTERGLKPKVCFRR